MAETKHVKGLSDLEKFLRALPVKMEKNIMRGALRAGAGVIKAEAVAECPVGPPSAEGKRKYGLYAGALRDSIRVSTSSKRGKVIASVKVGGQRKGGPNVFYAHIIEFTGATAHSVKGDLSIGGRFYRKINHPGMQAKPFLRPALDNKANAALEATGKYIKARLESKHGLDTAGIAIEVEE